MKIKVTVDGYGVFQVDNSKVNELLSWLSRNEAVQVTERNQIREVKNNTFTGRELING